MGFYCIFSGCFNNTYLMELIIIVFCYILTSIRGGDILNEKLILLFISIIKLMSTISKKETDGSTSASLALTNHLILASIILMLIILIIT